MNNSNIEYNKALIGIQKEAANGKIEEKTIKTGYQWLEEMVQIKNTQSSYRPNFSPLTNRAIFIINALNSIGVNYEIDVFDNAGYDLYDYDNPKLLNIIVKFGSRSGKPAIVFCAHHDIANIHSENCQDNSASVCNLLNLCAKLKAQAFGDNKDLIAQRPVIILFSDCEEAGGKGARRMSGRLLRGDFGNFEYVINLELTGLGSNVWIDTNNFMRTSCVNPNNNSLAKTPLIIKADEILLNEGYHNVKTPFSDAVIFRRCGIDSACIGILPLEQLDGRMNKETWFLCHSEEDTIEKCNEEDMSNFTNILERFVTHIQ